MFSGCIGGHKFDEQNLSLVSEIFGFWNDKAKNKLSLKREIKKTERKLKEE